MENPESLYLTLHGVPSQDAPNSNDIFFLREPQGTWVPSREDRMFEVERLCIRMNNAFEQRIFGTKEAYWEFLPLSPEFISRAGMNSESAISKDLFIKLLTKLPSDLPINKALYLYDCCKLVSSIQECSKEVVQLQGEFYKSLNLEELFSPRIKEEDGVRWIASPTVTKMFALLGFIYIRLHSLLDYTTKLAIEVEHLRREFVKYPRLASRNSLYSDRKRVSLNDQSGTLFEHCPELIEVETVRNHIIHDGLLDDMPKVYNVISGGKCIEKYLLFPDLNAEGRFETFTNRNLFYGREDKINLRLPMLISSLQRRLLETLQPLLLQLGGGD